MPVNRATIDAIVRDVLDQLPMMQVGRVEIQTGSAEDGCVLVRLEGAHEAHVLCEIDEEGRLRSARVVEG